jgi:hypothetical protein
MVPSTGASTSDLEKQFKVIEFLRKIPNHLPITADVIQRGTRFDLNGLDSGVAEMLRGNAKISVTNDTQKSGELLYQYITTHHASNKIQLLNLVNRNEAGLSETELCDTYAKAGADLRHMIRSGSVIAIKNAESKIRTIFPRDGNRDGGSDRFLVKLTGDAHVLPGGFDTVETMADLTAEIRRGEAVRIGENDDDNNWLRVSSAVRRGVSLSEQPVGAQAPLSVTINKPLSKRNKYCDEFNSDLLPINSSREEKLGEFCGALYRHGCTNDVRKKWADTLIGFPVDRHELEKKMVASKLLDTVSTRKKRPNFTHGDAQNKRPRKRRANTKVTNTHLVGTAIGDAIANHGEADDQQMRLGGASFVQK